LYISGAVAAVLKAAAVAYSAIAIIKPVNGLVAGAAERRSQAVKATQLESIAVMQKMAK